MSEGLAKAETKAHWALRRLSLQGRQLLRGMQKMMMREAEGKVKGGGFEFRRRKVVLSSHRGSFGRRIHLLFLFLFLLFVFLFFCFCFIIMCLAFLLIHLSNKYRI